MSELPVRPMVADIDWSNHAQRLQQLNVNVPAARDGLCPVVDLCLAHDASPSESIADRLRQSFDSISTTEGVYEALASLSHLLAVSTTTTQAWIVAPWTELADLTKKQPLWRHLFGPLVRIRSPYRFNSGPNGSTTCVLEAAVLVLSQADIDSVAVNTARPILRLIANCCADNNTNRSLIINTSGIHTLQNLIKKTTEVDVLLPTLYNVCVDYDEPAMDANGRAYHLSDQMAEAGSEVEESTLTKAEANLQLWNLLELDEKHFEACGAILADLLELSSRSALFDISIILATDKGAEENSHMEKGNILCSKLLSMGSAIAVTSAEAHASICQTYVNLQVA